MESNQIGLNILDLSDCDLLQILKHCTSTDLWQLSRTCSRFHYLVATKELWKKIDLQDTPITDEKIAFGLQMVNKLTKDVRLCSLKQNLEVAPPLNLQVHLKNANLTVLALENQKLCGNMINVMNFPKTLVELSLRKTDITNPDIFLNQGHKQMINLKVLILDQCRWVNKIEMLQLNMYQSLEVLSIYECEYIFPTAISCISLIKKLRILDCRCSPLTSNTLQKLYMKPTLQDVYFQNLYSLSCLDRPKRNTKNFKNHSHIYNSDAFITCEKLRVFFAERLVFSFNECVQEPPDSSEYESILYERPYRRCTCLKNKSYSQMSEASTSTENCYTADSTLFGRKQKQDIDEETDCEKVTMDKKVVQPTKHKGGVKRLSLRGYRDVTDDTLLMLTKLNLILLDVAYTSVTQAGIKEFTAINPECRVVHQSLCECTPREHI